MKQLIIVVFCTLVSFSLSAQTKLDLPYIQDYADKFEFADPQLNSDLLQVRSDRNKVVHILSPDGLLQPWESEIIKSRLYRPLRDMNIVAIDSYKNQLVYLTDEAVLSNAWAGRFYVEHELENATKFALAEDFTILVGAKGKLVLFKRGVKVWEESLKAFEPEEIIFDEAFNGFFILTTNDLYLLDETNKLEKVYSGPDLRAITPFEGDLMLGTKNGVIKLDGLSFNASAIDDNLPNNSITALTSIHGELWFGSMYGAFKLRKDGKYDYYASKRWLVDDVVVDIAEGPDKSVLVLSSKGLSKINFVEMTLAKKAEYFQEIQRLRHIRYGFTSELTLETPGDVSSGSYQDTDNDGLWTSMYLAGELFRYAVTKSDDAKQNAYEAFEAMERLTDITGLNGFPARTYERDGYEMGLETNGFSEEWRKEYIEKHGRIWRLSEDERWRWKSNTSSDELAGHFFAYALFAELAPDKAWRDRAIHQIVIETNHLIEHDWDLTDWNGEPTAWGRFNPGYVNHDPYIFGERRLNSTLILAFLQSAYHFTGNVLYKEKAYELIDKHGYDHNASSPPIPEDLSEIGSLADLGVEWNHSDDEMYFLTIPAFVNYSFTGEQKQRHLSAAKSHWEIERSEKNPLWNFLYALAGGSAYDMDESVWWLQEFPMDLVGWNIKNDHRNDLPGIEPNIRGQEYVEVLPPDECPVHLHNMAYINNGGNGAVREDPPYLFLLPYWMGKYLNVMNNPVIE